MSLHYFTLSCAKKSLMRHGGPCDGPGPVKCMVCAGRHYGPAKGTAVVAGQYAAGGWERRAVDLFLPVSEATAAGNRLRQARLPYEVIPNPLAAPGAIGQHAGLLDQLPDEPFLLFVGDVRREKGAHVLLDAYRALQGRRRWC